MYDLMIVGAGPAGMAASVYAARKQLNTILISLDIGGQLKHNERIENYLGYQFIEGWELVEKFKAQIRQYPIEEKIGQKVTNILKTDSAFTAITEDNGEIQAKAVIFAAGKRSRQLNIPGEKELTGHGVSYCAVCDGPLFSGKNVAVIGNNNDAVEAALDLVRIADHIYFFPLERFTAEEILVSKLNLANNVTVFTNHTLEEIAGDKLVANILIKNLKTGLVQSIDLGGVFIEVGMRPKSEPVKALINLNERGEILVNCSSETTIPGFFAAGDVTNAPEKQVVIAAGDGAKAALQAHRYLLGLLD